MQYNNQQFVNYPAQLTPEQKKTMYESMGQVVNPLSNQPLQSGQQMPMQIMPTMSPEQFQQQFGTIIPAGIASDLAKPTTGQPGPQFNNQPQAMVYQPGTPAPTNPYTRLVGTQEQADQVNAAMDQMKSPQDPAQQAPQGASDMAQPQEQQQEDSDAVTQTQTLWKPVSDSNGRLVVLYPYQAGAVSIYDADSKLLDTGADAGPSNGYASTVRFSKPGSAFQNVVVVDSTGRSFNVADGSARQVF